MELINFKSEKDFNLLLQCSVSIEQYTQKPAALYQIKTVSVPVKDNNTEAYIYNNTEAYIYTWL